MTDLTFPQSGTIPGIAQTHENGIMMRASCEIADNKPWVGDPGGKSGGVLCCHGSSLSQVHNCGLVKTLGAFAGGKREPGHFTLHDEG